MEQCIIYAAGYSPAMSYCIQCLKQAGFTLVSEPCEQVTHLLLPVPSFGPDGSIVGGGNLGTLLSLLPRILPSSAATWTDRSWITTPPPIYFGTKTIWR